MRRRSEVLTLLDRSQVLIRPLVDCDGLVALHDGDPVGAARYRRLDDHSAEVQLAIAEGWERLGVASTLLDLLAEEAEREGIRRFIAETDSEASLVLDVLTHWSPNCTVTIAQRVHRCEMPLDADVALQCAGPAFRTN